MLTAEPGFNMTALTEAADLADTQVILDGAETGDDLGYGPARRFDCAQVAAIAASLQALSIEDFSARYDPQAMDDLEIYPQIWGSDAQEGWVRSWPIIASRWIPSARQPPARISSSPFGCC